MNCDPNNLSKLSSCLRCLTDAQLAQIKTFLFCRWAQRASATPTNLDITAASTAANITLTWSSSASSASTTEVWSSTDGITFALLTTVPGNVTTVTDSRGLNANSFFYYKVRTCTSGQCTPFSATISACTTFVSANVASISFPTLIRAFGLPTSFMATGLAALTSVSLPLLKRSDGNIDLSGDANLTTVNLNTLQIVTGGALFLGSDKLSSLSLPALVSTASDIQVQGNTLCTSVSMPSLVTCGGILSLSGMTALASVNLNSLQTVGSRLDFNTDTSLTSISCPALTTVTGDGTNQINCSGCTLLSSWNAPVLLPVSNATTLTWNGDALNATSVNQILARGVAAATTTDTYNTAGGTNAAPSGQGVADKATLIGAGNTVTTN